ncbi:MAG: ABC transporter ATP-binding protein [Treponema sp.]|jgi:simple sugar transport system ATP-binding protein|nr:ABC transporter ATP-binding protein [Treponema sp.]
MHPSGLLLELKNITKVYDNGVVANRNIAMGFRRGEIHAIVGENGAGKTTLMNILFGLIQPTTGSILFEGKEQRFSSPSDSTGIGIGMVHQHFMLVPSFTVFENISLGCEETRFGFLSEQKGRKRAKELCERYNFDLPLDTPVRSLGVGVKQKVEILKLLYKGATILILDEPTAVLTPQETDQLFSRLKDFREQGNTIIFISHKLREVKAISDRITVIRRGESLGTLDTASVSVEDVSEMMIGRKVEYEYSGIKQDVPRVESCVEVKNLSLSVEGVNRLKDISFMIHAGEILGVVGVEGNGQTELVEVLFGYKKPGTGTMTVKGVSLGEKSIKKIRKNAKTAYIPEDRMRQGIAGRATVAENLISSYYDRPSLNKFFMMDWNAAGKTCNDLVGQFSIVCQSIDSPLYSLSGGNIQKVVVAREAHADPDFLIAEQPTRGVDIGSANAIHKILIGLRNSGKAILLFSADLGEALAMSDRLMVMYSGEIAAVFDNPAALSEQELGLYMLGIKRQ